jgi:hypothetical protein
MSDFWGNNIVPLSVVVSCALVFYGLGQLILADLKQDQLRYEQCISADKQWVKGSCVK